MVRSCACLAVLLLPLPGFAQGKLDAVREAVDQPRSSDRSSADADSCSSDAGASSGIFPSIYAATGSDGDSSWIAPDHDPFAGPWYVRGHSYQDSFLVRTSAEIGNDFDGLTRIGLQLFVDTEIQIGLKSNWDYYLEDLPNGRRDHLWIGDVTATYRILQSQFLEAHVGMGGRFLIDSGRDRAGLNLLVGLDAYPVQPLHLFGSVELGSLGNATVWRLHGGAGYSWNWGELFAGYDFLAIGSANLQGPFAGLRVWF